MVRTPLILDVDTGIDDAMALLLAGASPEVELIGVTCVMGNVTLEQSLTNTLAVLELAGMPEVEVAAGASRPLVRARRPVRDVHGPRGLGQADPPVPAASPSSRAAAALIVETARARPGEVVLVATGPLTNVAVAVAEEPELPTLLKGFAVMGGAYAVAGNVTPAAESNFWVDPEAARAVFHAFAGAPVERLPICIGLDVTERVRMTRAHILEAGAPAPGSPLARFVADAVSFSIDVRERLGAGEGASMHDPLALAVAIDPSFVELVATRVEVECEGRWTRGASVADLAGVRRAPWALGWDPVDDARVALEVDAERFLAWFVARLRALVETRA